MTDLELIRGSPLFAGLDAAGLAHFLRISQRASFAPGTAIVRQGRAADAAFILASGCADVITALPGGGELAVAELGPGNIVGEMALLENAVRSATVMARTECNGYLIERESFRMLLAQRDDMAFEIQNRITVMLCRRLRELSAKIVAASGVETEIRGFAGAPGMLERRPAAFNWRAFMPLLPTFRRFRHDELDEIADAAAVFAVDRGATVLAEGAAAAAAYAVVRGALEILRNEGGRLRRIGILGPGRLVGILALTEGAPQSLTVRARESAVLMEIGGPLFERLSRGRDRLAARFQDMMNQELLLALARTNNQLTRLISQARIRARRGQKKELRALEAALSAQDCAPAPAAEFSTA